jgi:hypothetical protein
VILDLIAATLQVMAFLDTGLTVIVVAAVLGVVLLVGGLLGIARARLTSADIGLDDPADPVVVRGAE